MLNHNLYSPHTLYLRNQLNIACVKKGEEERTRFSMGAALKGLINMGSDELSSISR